MDSSYYSFGIDHTQQNKTINKPIFTFKCEKKRRKKEKEEDQNKDYCDKNKSVC